MNDTLIKHPVFYTYYNFLGYSEIFLVFQEAYK